MRTMSSREIFTKKCRQKQNFDSDPKEAWHYNHVTFTPIAKNFMLYCRLIYMLSMLYVRLMIKVKVRIPESLKVGWSPPKITGSSHLKMFRYSFSEPYRYFSISLKEVFSSSDRYKIFTSYWLWIEICENVVLSKIDMAMTTINKKL